MHEEDGLSGQLQPVAVQLCQHDYGDKLTGSCPDLIEAKTRYGMARQGCDLREGRGRAILSCGRYVQLSDDAFPLAVQLT